MRVCMYKRDRERGEVTGARVSEEKGQQIPSDTSTGRDPAAPTCIFRLSCESSTTSKRYLGPPRAVKEVFRVAAKVGASVWGVVVVPPSPAAPAAPAAPPDPAAARKDPRSVPKRFSNASSVTAPSVVATNVPWPRADMSPAPTSLVRGVRGEKTSGSDGSRDLRRDCCGAMGSATENVQPWP